MTTRTRTPNPETRAPAPVPNAEFEADSVGSAGPTTTTTGSESAPAQADGSETVGPGSPELFRALAEVRGQAQFLLYLADQIEDSLQQFDDESDAAQTAFLCKILSMYSGQLETKYQGLGERVAETCQEVYITVRQCDAS